MDWLLFSHVINGGKPFVLKDGGEKLSNTAALLAAGIAAGIAASEGSVFFLQNRQYLVRAQSAANFSANREGSLVHWRRQLPCCASATRNTQ